MKKILLTGATGYIGSNLIRALSRLSEYSLSIVKRSNSQTAVIAEALPKIRIYDLNEEASNLYSILKGEQPDLVVHLATLYSGSHKPSDIEPMFKANILFGTKLLDAMSEAGTHRLINTGTFSEYSLGYPEFHPASLYASTKRAFEDILKFYVDTKGFKALTLKLYDTYGPHDPRPKIFSILKKAWRENLALEFSPGEQTIDLLYIDDVVAVFRRAIDYALNNSQLKDEMLFVGSGVDTSVKNVVGTFEEVCGGRLNIQWGRKPYRNGEIMTARADIRQVQEKLEWRPTIFLKEGLTKMLAQENLL